MKDKVNQAASLLAKKRWANTTPEERKRETTRVAKLPRTAKRCFCGASSMLAAANHYFDCCRRAGVITFNFERKREMRHESDKSTGT